MKLLIITQRVDKNDPVLGFFHRWLEVFATRFEKITVICLGKGEYKLPANVKVLSLGKEEEKSRFGYLWRFHMYIWQERRNYDAVFIHMNQEYVILGWKFWWLLGKKIYFWRNHFHGNILTRLAVLLSHKVFYTSSSSYTARFGKAVKMPVGIDTNFFKPDPGVARKPNSILFLGRIGPVKRVLEFVDWLNDLKKQGRGFTATIAGSALAKDAQYEREVKKKVSEYSLESQVEFVGAVNQEGALRLYQSHELYVNLTPAGSFDKTIVEAAACGMKLEVENPEARNLKPEEHSLDKLAEKLAKEIN